MTADTPREQSRGAVLGPSLLSGKASAATRTRVCHSPADSKAQVLGRSAVTIGSPMPEWFTARNAALPNQAHTGQPRDESGLPGSLPAVTPPVASASSAEELFVAPPVVPPAQTPWPALGSRSRTGSFRPPWLLSALIIAIVVLAAVGPFSTSQVARAQGPATGVVAVSPHGILTAPEYQALTRAQTTLKRVLRTKPLDWQAAYAACPATTPTPLLATESAGCSAAVAELHAIASTESAAKNEPQCVAQPGGTALSCLLPAYQNLASATTKGAAADEADYQAAVARGFTGTCLYTLADPPGYIHKEKQLAHIASETATAMRAQNAPRLEVLGPKLGTALMAVVDASTPSNLAACRHQ